MCMRTYELCAHYVVVCMTKLRSISRVPVTRYVGAKHVHAIGLFQPWPLVSEFLATLPDGSVGVDLGCGNGKSLHLRSVFGYHGGKHVSPDMKGKNSATIATLGSDRCAPLLDAALTNFPDTNDVAHRCMHEVTVADALCSGYRTGVFDYALSIATIHHFSTPIRRMHAIKELIRLVRPVPRHLVGTEHGHGRFMVYVWAFEQRGGGRRLFDAQLAEHHDATKAQDVLVPWVRTAQHTNGQEDVHQRCTYT